ncbi:telomeric repeat-binding factor 1 [Engraulis encrasicolus]|uniref:telomeric repeat-binding factor 1 n=1 Tax=Engraulis encrasicolus TaxID=184585 RepID=UPI002FD1D1FD
MNGNVSLESMRTITSTTEEITSFKDVDRLVKSWIIDYLFLAITHHFKDRNTAEFMKTVKAFEVMIDGVELEESQMKKKLVCGFLARIMDAKNLDVQYTHDEKVTPLMSAVTVWKAMDYAVADCNLHRTVMRLLFVQSVAICLEKGKHLMAKNALQWLQKECDLPQKLQTNLSSIVSSKNIHGAYLASFSFDRLLEKVHTFIETFIQEDPSSFLLQAGSKVVQAKQDKSNVQQSPPQEPEEKRRKRGEEVATPTDDSANQPDETTEQPKKEEDFVLHSKLNGRSKKRLLGKSRATDPWIPDTAKKSVRKARLKVGRMSDEASQSSMNTTAGVRTKKPWREPQDRLLMAGVRKYGEGKWAQILQEYDFEDRTAVMLKDRWRTLKKKDIVS